MIFVLYLHKRFNLTYKNAVRFADQSDFAHPVCSFNVFDSGDRPDAYFSFTTLI